MIVKLASVKKRVLLKPPMSMQISLGKDKRCINLDLKQPVLSYVCTGVCILSSTSSLIWFENWFFGVKQQRSDIVFRIKHQVRMSLLWVVGRENSPFR